jgi:hypothetical protein
MGYEPVAVLLVEELVDVPVDVLVVVLEPEGVLRRYQLAAGSPMHSPIVTGLRPRDWMDAMK